MDEISIRYIAEDVDAAVEFYTELLEFEVEMRPAPGFAALRRGPLRLLINAPRAGGAGQSMPDGSIPESGGWNRFQIQVDDLDALVSVLKERGARFRNEIVEGKGGKQVLIEDPAGNPVELFEPKQNR